MTNILNSTLCGFASKAKKMSVPLFMFMTCLNKNPDITEWRMQYYD